jgi:two-component sensor histidine kinase
MDNSQIDVNSDLKQDLVDKVLLIGTSLGVAVFLASLLPLSEIAFNADFYYDILAISVLFTTYFLRDKFSLVVKINTINLMLYLILVSDLIENGINTPDIILLVLIPFFTVLVYDLKIMLIVYGFCALTFLGIGHLYQAGIISSQYYNISESSVYRWYETLLMLSVVTFVITLFVSRFNTRLFKLIKNLEKQNTQLISSQKLIEESLSEKSVLLQEIHHRVKNNLAVVSGLLSLQSSHIKDEQLKLVLDKSMNRILSIAKVHEMLYESKKFNNIPFRKYIEELSEIILSSMNQENKSIDFNTNITVDQLSINQGVPLGIIFNELITNSVKYGFEEEEGNEITITVTPIGDSIKVVYTDNGIGINDFEASSEKSLGFTLIKSLMQQIEASYTFETIDQFKLTFEFPNVLIDSEFSSLTS